MVFVLKIIHQNKEGSELIGLLGLPTTIDGAPSSLVNVFFGNLAHPTGNRLPEDNRCEMSHVPTVAT